MPNLEKKYCAVSYALFFVLFAIVYKENVVMYAQSQRAFAVSLIALAGMIFNAVIVYRTLRFGNNSKLVSLNNVVGAWREHRLNDRQRLTSALVNVGSLLVFILLFWCFRRYLAGMVLSVAVLGYEISEILRARYERIGFWVFSFNVPVFIFILVFVFLFLLGGLQ